MIALSTDGLEWEASHIMGGEKVLSISAAVSTYIFGNLIVIVKVEPDI